MRFAHLALANVCDAAIRKDPNGPGDGKSPMERLNLKVGDMAIVDSSPTSITLQMKSNFTNPTNYTATIPYFNINVLVNGTLIGSATVENSTVHPGNNSGTVVTAAATSISWSARSRVSASRRRPESSASTTRTGSRP